MSELEKNNVNVFSVEYDYPNHNAEQIKRELALIHLTELPGSAPPDLQGKNRCSADDYVQLHYKTYLNETGHMVESTYQTYGKDSPIEIRLGTFMITKCLDMAVAQMKPGQKMKVDCPAKFSYGPRSPYGLGNEQIPKDSDLTYKLEVVSCSQHSQAKQKKTAKHKAKKDAQKDVGPTGKLTLTDEEKYLKFVETVIHDLELVEKTEEKQLPHTEKVINDQVKDVEEQL